LLVSDSELLARLSHHVDPWVATLTAQFWPGALTVVVNATDRVPDVVRRGLDTVGVRMPDDELALAIIQAAGGVLAVTSANPSGEPEARSAMEVWERLGGVIDGVVDGGQSPGAKPSTVVDVSGSAIRVLRDGVISGERIMAALGAGDPSGR
jgi:L-threonylcarbamoyladenylate synthase